MSPSLAPADLLSRVERDVQRAVRRSRNGLRYAAGTTPAEGRADAEGRRLAPPQGRAVALPLGLRAATARRW